MSDEEYEHLLDALGRDPSVPEVGVVSAMWSEHCSYKSSKVHLRKLPSSGPNVVQGPGENAGAVDIGSGTAAVFKIESHNHPSYIEPHQGAATGIGGILRDVFTMGARPVGLLDSLRFGSPDFERTPYLFHGVVDGIAEYGNCVGVPTVGGELYFEPAYDQNILVNCFAVGVCEADEIFRAEASGVGNPVYYVGAATGRDGIHGATMASEEFSEEDDEKRPAVQVGDPFREKLLIEACLELMETDAVVGIQDMGAAGLTSSAVEMADRGGVGLRIDVDRIPAREEGMGAYEFLLSESQERMLVVVEEGKEDELTEVFDHWELEWAEIGEVVDGERVEVVEAGEQVVDLDVGLLTSDAPAYDRPTERPAYLDDLEAPAVDEPTELAGAFADLLASPNICSRREVFEQYDHMVGVGTVVRPGQGDAAVLRLPETGRAFAITSDCNSRYCYLDPREGARLAVAEAARNLSCVGATPVGTTDCLNFGNPEDPEIMWQFKEAVEGMGEACEAFDAPVVSGNVSLYNATDAGNIYPTPTVAMVGRFDDPPAGDEHNAEHYCTGGFKAPGHEVWLLGETDPSDLGGSAYLWERTGGIGDAAPALDLDGERAVQALVRELIADGLVASAHDCSEGGLGVALAESGFMATYREIGLTLEVDPPARPDRYLFSESPSRIVVSAAPGRADALREAAEAHGVPAARIGTTAGHGEFRWGRHLRVSFERLERGWRSGLAALS